MPLPYSKRILLTLCGKSPAVITETVFALIKEKPEFIPDEIVALTTIEGRDCIAKELFESGIWRNFKSGVKVPPGKLKFGLSSNSIRLIPCSSGESDAADIVTSADNDSASDFVMETLRQFTENPDTQIVFSIAGGRKTMSAIGALAMSMLGRKQDRLSHVLVNSPFDSPALKPRFFYPDRRVRKYVLPDGRSFKPDSVSLTLCDISFVRLRELFLKQHVRLPGTYTDMVALANEFVRPEKEEMPKLLFAPKNMLCTIDDIPINLNAAEYVLYWLLALRCKKDLPPLRGQKVLLEEFHTFSRAVSPLVMPEIVNHSHFSNKTDEDMRKLVSSLSGKIKRTPGLRRQLACCLPSRGQGVYGLGLPPSSINYSGKSP